MLWVAKVESCLEDFLFLFGCFHCFYNCGVQQIWKQCFTRLGSLSNLKVQCVGFSAI